MDAQEFRALQESYNQVYELDEVSSADYTARAKTKKPRSKESIQARYHAKRLSKPEPERAIKRKAGKRLKKSSSNLNLERTTKPNTSGASS